MWILLKDGRYGRVEEIVDLVELTDQKTLLESKLATAQIDINAIISKIDAVKDPEIRAIIDKSLDDTVAPVVNLQNDLNALQGKIDEITQ